MKKIIKVKSTSKAPLVAGAIAGVFRERKRALVQAIGAGSVNQAVKAVALAYSFLRADGYRISVVPRIVEVDIDGTIITAVRFVVEEIHCS